MKTLLSVLLALAMLGAIPVLAQTPVATPLVNDSGKEPAIANASAPTLVEGAHVPLSVDLTGQLRAGLPTSGTFTNKSGSLTTGGTSQQLAASNTSRRQIVIQNPCSATSQGIMTAENLFINFTSAASATAGNSIELQPCNSYVFPSGIVSTEAITVNAATTGHQWMAKEF